MPNCRHENQYNVENGPQRKCRPIVQFEGHPRLVRVQTVCTKTCTNQMRPASARRLFSTLRSLEDSSLPDHVVAAARHGATRFPPTSLDSHEAAEAASMLRTHFLARGTLPPECAVPIHQVDPIICTETTSTLTFILTFTAPVDANGGYLPVLASTDDSRAVESAVGCRSRDGLD